MAGGAAAAAGAGAPGRGPRLLGPAGTVASGRPRRLALPRGPRGARPAGLAPRGRSLRPGARPLSPLGVRGRRLLLARLRALPRRRDRAASRGAPVARHPAHPLPQGRHPGRCPRARQPHRGRARASWRSRRRGPRHPGRREPGPRAGPAGAAYTAYAAHPAHPAHATDAAGSGGRRRPLRRRRGRYQARGAQRAAADGRGAGAPDPPAGAGAARRGVRLPPPQGGVPDRPGGRERHRGHPAADRPLRSGSGGARAGGVLALAGRHRPRGGRARFDSPRLQGPGDPGEGGVRALTARKPAGGRRRFAPSPSGGTCRASSGRRRSSGSARAAARRT